MADKPDPNDPSNVSAAWATMAPRWALIQTLLNGTAAMREAGTTYLPQHESESTQAYNERLQNNTLYNVTKLTLNALVGRPFQTEILPSEDTPEQVLALFSDIDLQGSSLHAFCREWFREGLAKAFCHILVDMNGVVSDGEGPPRTKADDIRDNARPFWKSVAPENLIAAYSEVINGVETLTHVRIRECEIVREGFLEVQKHYIRVLEPGRWALYEERKNPTTKKVEWVQIDSGVTGIDFIPLVTFYAARDGLMCGTPPLEDLAHLNVRHWQSSSDQINVLTVARFPMLAVAGAHEINSDTMAIGPRQLLGTRDANGRFYYVEHTGKAIEAGERDLAQLEELMGNYGAEFLKEKKAASRNPQDRIYDVTEATSELQEIVLRFQATVAQALAMTAVWLKLPLVDGKPFGGSVTLDNDFTIQDSNANDLQHLAQARKEKDVSHETYIDTLKRLNVLDDEIDTTEEVARAKKERKELIDEAVDKEARVAKAKAAAAPKPAPGAAKPAGEKDDEEVVEKEPADE